MRASEAAPKEEAPEDCNCEPFIDIVKDEKKYAVCKKRAESLGKLTNPKALHALIAPDMIHKTHEEFFIVGIGAHGDFDGKLMAYGRVAHGGQHRVEVEIEQICQILLGTRPDLYFLAHYHPSGDCTPSDEDVKLTAKIREGVAKALPRCIYGDHIVIADSEFYSMREDKKHRVEAGVARESRNKVHEQFLQLAADRVVGLARLDVPDDEPNKDRYFQYAVQTTTERLTDSAEAEYALLPRALTDAEVPQVVTRALAIGRVARLTRDE